MLAAMLALAIALQDPLPITLRQAWVRGDDADTLVSFSRLTPSMVGLGPDDKVYILDVDRRRVVVLDPAGKTLAPLGRQGNGPGELANPVSLAVAPTGSVLVWDFARQGFTGWSKTMSPLPTLPFARPGIPNNVQAVSDSLLYFTTITPDSLRLIRYTPQSWTVVEAHPQPEPLLVGKGLCGLLEYRLPPVFSPYLTWSHWGSDLAVSRGPEFQVRISTPPSPARVLAAPTKPRPATRKMAIDLLGPERVVVQGRPACKVPPERIIDAVGMASHLPSYQRLVAASPATIWAVRYTLKGEAAVADIFDKKSGYRGSVPLGSVRPVAFLSDGRLLSLETTVDDIPVVAVYAVLDTRH